MYCKFLNNKRLNETRYATRVRISYAETLRKVSIEKYTINLLRVTEKIEGLSS